MGLSVQDPRGARTVPALRSLSISFLTQFIAICNAVILLLALLFTSGVLLQLLGCVLWHNWWPMLSGVLYILIPMPYIFFGSSGGDGYTLYGGGSSLQSGWVDAGKFLTGFSAIGAVAVPAILAHAQVITTGALVMELSAAFVLGATVVTYDYLSHKESMY